MQASRLTSKQLNGTLPYMFDDEPEYLADLASQVNEVVVLGAGPGVMSLVLLENNPLMSLVAIDHNPKMADFYRAHMIAAGFLPNIYVGKTTDSHILEAYSRHSIDLLIIDASHIYEHVMNDFAQWYERVKPNGYIFFHDYIDKEQNGTNGVKRAVDQLVPEFKLTEVARPGVSFVCRK